MNRFCTLTLLLVLSFTAVNAQYTRHIVAFKDKKGTTGTFLYPAGYLSQKAIDRRTRYNITIDSTDLPISKPYLDSIAAVPGVTILNQSKWMNQVLIRVTDINALTKINSFPFVKSANSIAPRIAPGQNGRRITKNIIEETEIPVDVTKQQGTNDVNLDYGTTLNQIRIHKGEYLHNLGFSGQNVTIAVLDAGFRNYKTNPALDSVRLQGRFLGEWDYVANHASVTEDDTHGSNCLTIIASNRPGLIVGSAPHSKFWLLRTEDVFTEYPVEEQNWAAAAEFADSVGADMISSSLGYADFDDPAFDHSYPQRNGNTSISTIAADYAAKKGMIIMNSAGNSGNDPTSLRFVNCPADGDSVFTVGAVDVNGNLATFSSWGPNGAGKLKPNIVSVGQGTVYASSTTGNPASGNGTSYSNPNAAGLVACLWQAFPELSNMEIMDAVQKSSHKFDNPDIRLGYGIPDFRKAFLTVLKQRAMVSIGSNPGLCAVAVTWSSKDNNTMRYKVQRKFATDTGFITIKTVVAAGTEFNTRTYSHVDNLKDFAGAVQYRVLQDVTVDTTLLLGAGSVTITTACPSSLNPSIGIAPNPVKDDILKIVVSVGEEFNAGIVIVNMYGQVVKKINRTIPQGVSVQQVAISNLPHGMYMVKAYAGDKEVFTGKFMK